MRTVPVRNLRILLAIFIAIVIAGPVLAAEEVDLLLVLVPAFLVV